MSVCQMYTVLSKRLTEAINVPSADQQLELTASISTGCSQILLPVRLCQISITALLPLQSDALSFSEAR